MNTDHETSLAALAMQLHTLQTTLDHIGAYVYAKDLQGRYTYANQMVRDLFGVEADAILGKDDSCFFSLERSNDLKQNDRLVLQEGKTIQIEERNFISSSGEERIYWSVKKPLRDDEGAMIGMFGVSTDITSQKQMESQLQERVNREVERRMSIEEEKRIQEKLLLQQAKMADMGEMISAIAHQWKQPLSTIHMAAFGIEDMLDLGDLDTAKVKESIALIIQQIRYMSETIDEFRSFFKPSKTKEHFHVCKAAISAFNLLKPKFKRSQIVFISNEHRSEEPHFMVYGYPGEFKQAIINILNNAHDAIEERGIKQGVIRMEFAKEGERGEIIISDNGGGIAPELLPEKLFELYVSSKGARGTGLGLHLARLIIEQKMGGRITASNSAEGARFVISLPLVEPWRDKRAG